MRKVSFALAFGVVLCACGGEENKPPQTPATPVASTPAPTTSTPDGALPKEEAKPKETLGQLQEKAGRGMTEATNAHDSKKLASFYNESAVVKIAGAPADATGRDAIAQSWQKLFDAFPDFKTSASRVWVKGEVVVVEWAFNGTHQGDLWGIKGTEKKVGSHGIDVLWFTPEGQVKEHHIYYDGGTILSQIGVSKQKARPIPAIPSSPQVFMSKGEPDEAKNVEVAKAMTAAFEAKKDTDWVANMSDTIEWDDMSQPQTAKGKGDAKKFMKEMSTAFPDAKPTISNTWTFGEYVITEGSWTGTHKGSFFGIPATKKTVTSKAVDIMQFKDGKLVKGWSYSNGADFMQQLGQMPAPGATKTGAKPADAKAGAKPTDPKATPAAGAKPADAKAPAAGAGAVKPAEKK
jgi:steroid delta-isomerase-like uncharacterized protein